MKSSGDVAGRRSILASWIPPSMKWVWESMNPGVTSPAPLVRIRVAGPTRRAISALSPTAAIRSPRTATAEAQGRALSPVQIRPYTTRSAGSLAREVALPPDPPAVRKKREAASAGRRMASGSMNILAKFGEPADGLELLQGAAARCRGGHRKEVADVEQDLQHELVAHVGALEVDHPTVVAGRPGAVVGFAVDRLEVGKDAVAGAHGRRGKGEGKVGGKGKGERSFAFRLSPFPLPFQPCRSPAAPSSSSPALSTRTSSSGTPRSGWRRREPGPSWPAPARRPIRASAVTRSPSIPA